jgi:hypothetical protein
MKITPYYEVHGDKTIHFGVDFIRHSYRTGGFAWLEVSLWRRVFGLELRWGT